MIHLRPAIPSDLNYVRKTWLDGARNPKWGATKRILYYRRQRKFIEAALTHASVTVAHWDDDPDTILGFAVTGPSDLIHWVSVRKEWWGHGVARALLASYLGHPARITHGGEYSKPLPAGWRVDPKAVEW